MIRHGEAAADWGSRTDPGLSAKGHAQAAEAVRQIEARVSGTIPIVSSPLRRCRETAAPLSTSWNCPPVIETRVSEIPSPMDDLGGRSAWLRTIAPRSWPEFPELMDWRRSVINALASLRQDTVIFSHYIAINVAMGEAIGDERVVCFRPDNASITIFETSGGRLKLLERGREADTKVN
jgi:broad specificity phosphatase PhoE